MATDKELSKKYKDAISIMKGLGMEDYEIFSKLHETEDLAGWAPITLKELMAMKPEKLSELKSYCWKNGKPRCDCIGISELKIEEETYSGGKYWSIDYSDENGDPHFTIRKLTEKINKVGDGTWDYGLFKKKK